MNLWWQNNKGNRLHNKGCYHKGKTTWHSFALRDWAYKPKSTWQPLLRSAKGLSFTFMYLLSCKRQSFSLYSFYFSPLASIVWWENIYAHISSWIWVAWVIIVDITLVSALGGETISPYLPMCLVEMFFSCVRGEC